MTADVYGEKISLRFCTESECFFIIISLDLYIVLSFLDKTYYSSNLILIRIEFVVIVGTLRNNVSKVLNGIAHSKVTSPKCPHFI